VGFAGSLMSWMVNPPSRHARIAALPAGDHVMQGDAACLWASQARGGRFMPGSHIWRHLRLAVSARSTMHRDVVGEAVEVRRDIGVASSGHHSVIPKRAFEKAIRAISFGWNVVDGKPDRNFLRLVMLSARLFSK